MSKAHSGHHGQSGVQNHSAGPYWPVAIKTIGDPAPVAHVACFSGKESGRFDSFTDCERFAVEVANLIKAGDSDSAILLLEVSKGF